MKQLARIHDLYRPVAERVRDYQEVERRLPAETIREQASRCADCGIPFCHGAGCPLGNYVPDFNAAAAAGNWAEAYRLLAQTSFFPEFTCRICPALCEGACCQGVAGEPVMIRQCEKAIIETAFQRGMVRPVRPVARNGRRIAVVGSGPSGLFAAEALNRAGFSVTVYEAMHRPGGLLRYGIPDFKLDKRVIDRRLEIMKASGIEFVTDTRIGQDISGTYLTRHFDATVLAIGTPEARDLKIPGREFKGIHLALEFLRAQTRLNHGESSDNPLTAAGKRVLIIGGGDTGSDCAGTAFRQGAAEVRQIEIMPMPPESRSPSTPWPQWPWMLRTSSSHLEGCAREWNLASDRFLGNEEGKVIGVEAHQVEWSLSPEGRPLKPAPVAGSERVIECDMVLLAMGFTGVPAEGLAAELDLDRTPRGALLPAPERHIYVLGDCANGASLVVRAMADAKKVTRRIIEDLRS